jgi:TatD DNase family protein
MFDAHTHLNDDALFPNRQDHMTAFQQQWGKWLINVATDLQRAQRGIDIAQTSKTQFPDLYVKSTVGFHPSEVCFGAITKDNINDHIHKLKIFLEKYPEDIVAIGECGIDLHYPGAQDDIQVRLQADLFAHQCEIAREFKLPVVIHSRDGYHETIDVLKNFPDLKIYFHCFWYWPEELQSLQDSYPNIRFGFDGNITYPKAQNLRDSLALCQKTTILLETDAPYLAPIPLRGTTNEPKNINIIYEYVAKVLNRDQAEMKKQIEENFWKLYT